MGACGSGSESQEASNTRVPGCGRLEVLAPRQPSPTLHRPPGAPAGLGKEAPLLIPVPSAWVGVFLWVLVWGLVWGCFALQKRGRSCRWGSVQKVKPGPGSGEEGPSN